MSDNTIVTKDRLDTLLKQASRLRLEILTPSIEDLMKRLDSMGFKGETGTDGRGGVGTDLPD